MLLVNASYLAANHFSNPGLQSLEIVDDVLVRLERDSGKCTIHGEKTPGTNYVWAVHELVSVGANACASMPALDPLAMKIAAWQAEGV